MSLLVTSVVGLPKPTPGRNAREAKSHSHLAPRLATGASDAGSPVAAGTPFKHMPVRFEVNAGQTDSQVRFIASTPGGDMFLTPSELVMRVFEPMAPPDKKARKAHPVRPAP
ncbi:MAG TPA: hypothetical protein VI756_09055, partial [Blastocatellia bacterium]